MLASSKHGGYTRIYHTHDVSKKKIFDIKLYVKKNYNEDVN